LVSQWNQYRDSGSSDAPILGAKVTWRISRYNVRMSRTAAEILEDARQLPPRNSIG
jgi:hypothetical protein